MKKNLKKIALLSSTLFLVGCGGNSGGGSSTGDSSSNQANLTQTQAELRSIQAQTDQLSLQLTTAKQETEAKKKVLDDLQSKVADGSTTADDVTTAQAEYDQASYRLAEQEKEKARLDYLARQLKEKLDTAAAKVKVDSTLNNVVPSILSETFSSADLKTTLNAIQTKTAAQLVAPFNKATSDLKSALSTGAKLKSAVPKLVNSPIIDSVLIPVLAKEISNQMQETIQNWLKNFPAPDKVTLFTPYFFAEVLYNKDAGATDTYTLGFPLKDVIKKSTVALQGLNDGGKTYQEVQSFIDKYFENNAKNIQASVNLNFDVKNPAVLQKSIQSVMVKLKPVLADVVGKVDISWLNFLADQLRGLDFGTASVEGMEVFKADVKEFSDALAKQALSAEAPVSTSSTVGHRKVRCADGGVGLNQFTLDGNTLNQSYALDMPLRVDLKGQLTSGKTTDVIGSVTYNLNGTVMGVVQGYNNTVDVHAETSVLLSQSMGDFFIEAQAGYVGVREGQFSGWEGQRYQATFGYDAALVSPFVQVEYRPLSNGFSTLDATALYVGLESDVVTVELTDAKFTSSVLAKVGYESTHQTMFGQSLKPNQGGTAFVEWNGALTLSSGLELKSALTLSSKDQSVKLNFAFEH